MAPAPPNGASMRPAAGRAPIAEAQSTCAKRGVVGISRVVPSNAARAVSFGTTVWNGQALLSLTLRRIIQGGRCIRPCRGFFSGGNDKGYVGVDCRPACAGFSRRHEVLPLTRPRRMPPPKWCARPNVVVMHRRHRKSQHAAGRMFCSAFTTTSAKIASCWLRLGLLSIRCSRFFPPLPHWQHFTVCLPIQPRSRAIWTLPGVLPSGALNVIRDQINRVASQGHTKLGLAFIIGFLVYCGARTQG
jgi:hypothetical protein